ncbi:energy transducer TonB [Ruegeria profundi]|uniref:energy transducer TonB n=1 Tax=Ruegeria profundi TaxID=1685378 RepID=UPI001CD45E77|nr:energy transducer TonB [Ruegeria profundi]MCA0927765.1 energy transducer TonB [Ruegeria profundi]
MDTGTKISAIAHVTLIGWALFGGTFRSEPLPMAVQEVSVVSAEQFAALTAQSTAPEVPTPSALQPPEAPTEDVTPPEATEEELTPPEVVTPPEPDPDPVPEPVEAPPEPELVEEPPTLDQPETVSETLPVPPGPEAQPRPADKVAPQPIAPPPPEAQPDEVETPAVSLDDGSETQQEQQDQTAPEEATDQIVTEAEETKENAPRTSPRPRVRPNRPAPPAEPEVAEEQDPTPPEPAQNDTAIDDALAEALGQNTAPSGPPLTSGEKDAMRLAVSQCWNVGSLSTDALQTVVVVAFSLTPDGKVVGGSLRMIDSSGGTAASANQAFEAARRAILRCGAKGYTLPAEKYEQWQDIEITFNPERMRIK